VYLRGDENNTQPQTNPYAVFNLDATWSVMKGLAVYVRANNIFSQKYETAGQYGDGSGGGVFSGYSTQDRFLTSGLPANVWLGTRVSF
jgi:outer membrane receptor protein involved in Fe transport